LISLNGLKKIIKDNKHRYTIHAQEQMALRHIRNSEVIEVIVSENAEIIEKYSDDKYSPSCLTYGVTEEGRILHVLSNCQGVIITVYEPNLTLWCEDMKTRRL
jgi:hypothetical protein